MTKRTITIRQAEGGQDSRLFCNDLFQGYMRLCKNNNWTVDWIDEQSTQISFNVEGKGVEKFDKEIGGHRIQRVPPTERSGRIHTSTVTVSSVEISKTDSKRDKEYVIEYFSGTGKGGQHRNRHKNSVRLRDVESGLHQVVQGRSKLRNEMVAKQLLSTKIDSINKRFTDKENFCIKRNQMGTGERGDKRRTYRFQENVVKDHLTNKKCSIDKILNEGEFDLLW